MDLDILIEIGHWPHINYVSPSTYTNNNPGKKKQTNDVYISILRYLSEVCSTHMLIDVHAQT